MKEDAAPDGAKSKANGASKAATKGRNTYAEHGHNKMGRLRCHVSHKVYNPCIQERHVKHFVLIRTLQGFQALLAAEKGKTLGMVKTHMLQDF